MPSIDEAKLSNYEYMPSKNEQYIPGQAIVTVIIDCYYKLDLVKQSIQSVLNQDYHNVELLLIDNGAEDLVSDYIRKVYEKDKNIALIKFNENQFSWEDTLKVVAVCWNSGVLHSKGEIIAHLSYDDMLSKNCCSRMAKLFVENNNCVTAGPLPLSIDFEGNINEEFSERLRINNSRKKYLSGKKLAIDYVTGNPKKYFSAPGGVLFVRKNIILETGGFDRASDVTQVIKFAIFGDSGFDPEAKLYWRHHEGQLNKIAKKKGMVWCTGLQTVVTNENIIEIWRELFTRNQVQLLNKFIKNSSRQSGSSVALEALRNKEPIVFFRVIKNIIINCPYFLFYVLWFSLLEVLKMFYEKVSNIVGYK